MNWEETIEYIRTQDDFQDLVRDAYFDEDLEKNLYRFYSGEEYKQTKNLLESYGIHKGARILDLGAGNGISSLSFALDGYQVIALEPDESESIGAGAIKKLKQIKGVDNLEVVSCYAEDAPFEENTFDLVYARQALHHANDLNRFVKQVTKVLKPGGYIVTVRDHVINETQLDEFLDQHPLHKFYGGENAYTLNQYLGAFQKSGLTIKQIIKPYDSVINYAPTTEKTLKDKLDKILPGSSKTFLYRIFLSLMNWRSRNVPGRNYSFVCQKTQ